MIFDAIIWDLDDDPHGNVQHCAEHGVTKESMTLRRVVRNRKLTRQEAAKYRAVREEVAEELPELVGRHQDRIAAFNQLAELLRQLKAEREERGLSLSDLTELTGMDRSALSKLETGHRPNPTLETLVRYAEAVGKRLVVSLADR